MSSLRDDKEIHHTPERLAVVRDAATHAESARRQYRRRIDHSRAMMAQCDMWVVENHWEFDKAAGKFVLVWEAGYEEDTPGVLICDAPDGL